MTFELDLIILKQMGGSCSFQKCIRLACLCLKSGNIQRANPASWVTKQQLPPARSFLSPIYWDFFFWYNANDMKKALIVTVDMGYGHQRTVYPLRNLAFKGKIINANNYEGMPESDRLFWGASRKFYEFISDFKKFPLIGNTAFSIFDKFQQIPNFYPRRDLSRPTLSLKNTFAMFKRGWGEDLISKLNFWHKKLGYNPPLITSFFTPAFMAENFGYKGDIFCIICDADIARPWVSLNPKESRIKYLAPNSWTVDRLALYGVKEKNIFLTGYPLPIENIGTSKMEVLKKDLGFRILNLDPEKAYYEKFKNLITKNIGSVPKRSNHKLTMLFSVGGAGAQKELAMVYIDSLLSKIKKGDIKIILSAGIREKVRDFFNENLNKIGLKGVDIIFDETIPGYFKKFNQALRKTDILWTKPSELSFYSGLGLPIIIAPSIGSQEDFNRKWLLRTGAGLLEEDPRYAHQWIFDYLESGRFAEAAMHGFIDVEKLGVYNIEKVCL